MRLFIKRPVILFFILTIAATAVFTADAEARTRRGVPSENPYRSQSAVEIILEAGMAMPMLDLEADYLTTDKGLSAELGFEFGGRVRQYFGQGWSVSPSFHYVRFGSHKGVYSFDGLGDNLAYEIKTSSYKYGVQLEKFIGSPRQAMRPFLIAGVALSHNCYEDILQYNGTYDTSVNAASFSAGLGLKMHNLELSGVYNFNRFDTTSLPPSLGNLDYEWDYLAIRLGFAFDAH